MGTLKCNTAETTHHVLAVSSKGFFYIQPANRILHVVVDIDRTLSPYCCLGTGTGDGLDMMKGQGSRELGREYKMNEKTGQEWKKLNREETDRLGLKIGSLFFGLVLLVT